MADLEALKSQADLAYTAGSQYLTVSEGWIAVEDANSIKVSYHPAEIERVIKVEGEINKSPQFTVKFLAENQIRLRQTYFKNNSGIEIVKTFEDHSHIVKELTRNEALGEVA